MANMIFDAAFLSREVSGDGTSPEYEPIQRVVAEKIYIFSLLATVCDTRYGVRHSSSLAVLATVCDTRRPHRLNSVGVSGRYALTS